MLWKTGLVGVVLAALAGLGCRQQSFLTEADYHDARGLAYTPHLEADLQSELSPRVGTLPVPTTVDDTQRETRYLSLREAIAIALENGTVGSQNALAPGFAIDLLGGFQGRTVQSADGIRVLAFDPAIVANDIETALSKFDAFWNNSFSVSRTESPLGISPTTFTQTGPSIAGVSTDNLNFNTALIKPLPTGGVAGITFAITRQRSSPTSAISPAIQPSIQFTFEQPLLQGFGEEINQLRETHPGSILTPFSTASAVEGILITRIRLDQQRAEFERTVNYLLLNVEAAYWNLYGAYYQLYSREEGMRYAYESWRLTKELFDTGRASIQTLEQIRVQYEQFRSQRLTALGQVLESERQLRGLLGLKVEDGYRLVPADSPTLTPMKPDWYSALNDALARRPELLLARQDLKFRQLDLIRQRNNLLPDLRFFATDTIHSVGSQLDGGRAPENAFHELVTDPFNNWSFGLQMNVPIGFRAAHAAVRDAQLNLRRSYTSLLTEEDKAERFLGLAYRQVLEFQEQIPVQEAVLRAATAQLDGIYKVFKGGRAAGSDANLILALQNFSNSVASYYAAIVQYNNALATFEFAKGSIMERDSVAIGEGPLPACAQVRAVEHERERTRAIILREFSRSATPALCQAGPEAATPRMPDVPADTVLSLPALQHQQPPVPALPAEPAARLFAPPDSRPSLSDPEALGDDR
jgi:outer membrane protein TolC